MRSRLLPVVTAAASVAFLVACQEAPTSPRGVNGPAAPTASFHAGGVPSDGNGNKVVSEFEHLREVDCGGGVTLDFSLVGWMQIRLFNGDNNRNVELDVFHGTVTYTNPATGESLSVRDVGPNHLFFNQDGDLVVAIIGRVPGLGPDAFIGQLVFNITDGVVEFVAGRFFDGDAIACEQLG